MSKENLSGAVLERFPFLAPYVPYPSVWNIYVQPVDMDLARKYPEISGSWRCQCETRIVLLGATGHEIGFVGQRSRFIPESRFLWWTIKASETVRERFHETVQQALQRFSEPVSWVLAISEQGMSGGYNATMFFPPDGQSVNECLSRLLEEQRQAQEARSAEIALRRQQQEEEALAKQRERLDETLKGTEA